MLPLAEAEYCLVVRPVLPSYMRLNCLGWDPGELKTSETRGNLEDWDMLPLAGAEYCLVVRPVLPSYMR